MTMRVISLGWGVQSFALAAMSALGELPPVDAAIHADTTHERSETYAFAAKWTPWLEERGVKVITVKDGRRTVLDAWGGISIPAYCTYPDGKKSGMMRRQCTDDWKRAPMRRWLQERREGETVDLWLGITLDEWTRMKDSDVKYIRNVYPFMDFDPPWSRLKVLQWLEAKGLEIPVKSRCVFCTFQTDADWRETKLAGNGDWDKALFVDDSIRWKRDNYRAYLHRSCLPLSRVDLRNEQDHGQLTLWDEEECSGTCFL